MSNDWVKAKCLLARQLFITITSIANAFLKILAKMVTEFLEGFVAQITSHCEKNAECYKEWFEITGQIMPKGEEDRSRVEPTFRKLTVRHRFAIHGIKGSVTLPQRLNGTIQRPKGILGEGGCVIF